MPLPVKRAKLLFQCTCRNSFTHFVCEESLACSMLFDSTLKEQEKESSIHVKDRERAKLDNPFNAGKLKVLEPKSKSKKEDVWAAGPTNEVCNGIEEGSSAAMVQPAKRRLEVSTLCPAVMRARF